MDEKTEKRASERRTCNALISFSHFNQIYSYDAKILNYGDGGLCFRCNHFLKPGATVCIRLKENQSFSSLEGSGNGLRSISLAEVKWCTEVPGADSITYGVGVKYQPPDY